MPTNWDDYTEKLSKIIALHDHEVLEKEEMINGFPPTDDIQFRHELITPSDPDSLVSRSLTTGNLTPIEAMTIRKAGLFATWINSIKGTFNLSEDKNLIDLENEVKKDIAIVANISKSKKGWLVDTALNPKKKYQFFGDRGEKRFGLFNKRGELNE